MLFMIPVVDYYDAPIRSAEPVEIVYEAPVEEPAAAEEINVPTYNGKPIPISPGVTLMQSDGFFVTMSQYDADRMAEAENIVETEEEYHLRLCQMYNEAKPWIAEPCE